MPVIFGIDPGSRESGYVLWDTGQNRVFQCGNESNEGMLDLCRHTDFELLAIEQIRGYGIVAGDDIFDTCEAYGRFREAYECRGLRVIMVPRKNIKKHLCGVTTTNDKYIRMALIDRLGEVGTKRSPGPLFGISGHLWSALAVCIYVADNEL
jgi:hypothetical protein